MKYVLYYIFTCLLRLGAHITALFNLKARQAITGHKDIFKRLEQDINGCTKIIWVHCSSLGEFEQGRPVIEKLKLQYTDYRILLTFFSPSGYELRKNYDGATWVYYLPFDSPQHARKFISIVNPSIAIFIKYEFWYYYLKQLRLRQIPTLLISALFLEQFMFFKWYGGIGREMLDFFTHLFVQDEHSYHLLKKIGFAHKTSISGDTRFDRVITVAENAPDNETISAFAEGEIVLIAGSTWPPDEELIQKTLQSLQPFNIKLVCAPHNISEKNIADISALFPGSIRYSHRLNYSQEHLKAAPVLIIDNMGMLSQVYRYARVTYIGGGFGKGIHNILEAAVYGKPVIFGPQYEKFAEAKELIKSGGAFSIKDENECIDILLQLLTDAGTYHNTCTIAYNYVHHHKGATEKVLRYIYENRLLIN